MSAQLSAFDRLVRHLVRRYGRAEAGRRLVEVLGALTNVERAALAARWATWARPKQLAPRRFRRWGFITGRGYGKTRSIAQHINRKIEGSHTPRHGCLIAQDEQSSIDIQVLGPSGLVATAPPWFRPEWEASSLQLVWPNGSRAYVRTPEAPGKIRGLEYSWGWASEIQSWPVAQRLEAWSNLLLSVRLGAPPEIYWDATPKKRHPILLELLADADSDPENYPVVRGTTHENAANLGEGYVDELEKKYGGTSKGREELLGEMLDDAELAVAAEAIIERYRRPWPRDGFARCALGVDPAITSRKGSHTTGIVKSGLGHDGQGYVLRDRTGKYPPNDWASIVLDEYDLPGEPCDVVLVETNKGGELVVQNLRAVASTRGLRIAELGLKETPRRKAGVVNVKALYSQGSKLERAEPVGIAYQRGRISHVAGADLASLEDTLTTWEPVPGADSPGDLDALVFTMVELLGLKTERKSDGRATMQGIVAAQQKLVGPRGATSGAASIAHILRGLGGRGGRI